MHETSTAMVFLLKLLNINFESTNQQELKKIEALRQSGSHYKDRDMAVAQSVLKRQIAFITDPEEPSHFVNKSKPANRLLQNALNSVASELNLGGSNPHYAKLSELVDDLNDWAENTGPDTKGIHPRWRLRTAEKARKHMEPGQAILKLG